MSNQSAPPVGEREEQKENKVRSMATQLLARFEENAPSSGLRRQVRLLISFFFSSFIKAAYVYREILLHLRFLRSSKL